MITKVDIINFLLSVNNGKSYLEVGSGDHSCFRNIICGIKHDIDPFPPLGIVPVFKMTSDEAFSRMNNIKYDVIFIDALHYCEQVAKDVYNASKHLNPTGFIVLHDCMPEREQEQERIPTGGNWTGDVWKFQAWLVKKFENVWTIAENWGCGVISGPVDFEVPSLEEMQTYDWQTYIKNRISLLRVIEWSVFRKMLEQIRRK